jgi:hypothetical protein
MIEAALAYMPALTASTMESRCGRNHGKAIQRQNDGGGGYCHGQLDRKA